MSASKEKVWKKYAFEFISIFVAVVSAFALTKWNDNRKDHIAEKRILTEIYNGLENDIKDLKENEGGHKMGLRSIQYFAHLIKNEPESNDSAIYFYYILTRSFISLQNTSGYETLKSKGLEIIQNDSLRTHIIHLYEYDYSALRKLEEDYHEMQFGENYFHRINDILSESFLFDEQLNFIGFSQPLKITPSDEKKLIMYLLQIQNNRRFILEYYKVTFVKIEALKQKIKKEIDN